MGNTDDQPNRRSTYGYFTFKEGTLIIQRNKNKKVVAWSSTEAKFQGMDYSVCELLWIKSVLKYLGIKYVTPTSFHCDNKIAIETGHNLLQHKCTKHVIVDHHFIKENL